MKRQFLFLALVATMLHSCNNGEYIKLNRGDFQSYRNEINTINNKIVELEAQVADYGDISRKDELAKLVELEKKTEYLSGIINNIIKQNILHHHLEPFIFEKTANDQYVNGIELLASAKVEEARTLLSSIAQSGKIEESAAKSSYIISTFLLVDQKWNEAAKSFLSNYEKYKEYSFAPYNLVKAAQAFKRMNNIKSSCVVYSKILKETQDKTDNYSQTSLREARVNFAKLKCSNSNNEGVKPTPATGTNTKGSVTDKSAS